MKKRGFTLVELLAVLVILSLISLIIIPVVTKNLRQYKVKLCENQLANIVTAAKVFGSEKLLLLPNVDSTSGDAFASTVRNISEVDDLTYDGSSYSTLRLTLGYLIDNGYIKGEINNPVTNEDFSTDMEIIIIKVVNEYQYITPTGLCGTLEEEDDENTYNLGTEILYNPLTNRTCTEGSTNCFKWNVITTSDVSSNTSINVIMNENLIDNVAFGTNGQTASFVLENNTGSWVLTPRLITADEIASITLANTRLKWVSSKTYAATPNLSTTISSFYLDGKNGSDNLWKTQVANGTGTSAYPWLFDNTTSCTTYGCNSASTSNGYWTSTQTSEGNTSWYVSNEGMLSTIEITDTNLGIRPVLTINKSILQIVSE